MSVTKSQKMEDQQAKNSNDPHQGQVERNVNESDTKTTSTEKSKLALASVIDQVFLFRLTLRMACIFHYDILSVYNGDAKR